MTDSVATSVLEIRRIGVIHSPFTEPRGTPIQPTFAAGGLGRVALDAPYVEALADVEGFDRLWLLYWLDRATPWKPRVTPYRDTVERGLFATRAPSRPNPIGLSVVRLRERRGAELLVADLDILDGTPLLDIKPYVPSFDAWPDAGAGWLDHAAADRTKADGRFHDD